MESQGGQHLRLRSRRVVRPVAGSVERRSTVLVMRSTAAAAGPVAAAAREADSCSEKPLASCSSFCCVRSCRNTQRLVLQ